jgi:Sulfotransferase family
MWRRNVAPPVFITCTKKKRLGLALGSFVTLPILPPATTSPPSPPDRRFFFAHVQKAAGTSLVARVKRHFREDEVYPDPSDVAAARADGPAAHLPRLRPTLLVSHLLERYAARREAIRVVTGHFPVRTTELLGDEFTTITVLREPIERTLSALRHQQARTPADRDRSLEELYDDPIRFHGLLHNHMVKMLSLSPDEIRSGDGVMARVETFDRSRLEDAIARLEAVDVVGLHDGLDAVCAELSQRFGWELGDPVHANRTAPIDAPASLRERIATDNALDIELYEHARRLVTSTRRGRSPSASG